MGKHTREGEHLFLWPSESFAFLLGRLVESEVFSKLEDQKDLSRENNGKYPSRLKEKQVIKVSLEGLFLCKTKNIKILTS